MGDDASGHSCDGYAVWHILAHYSVCTDHYSIANPDTPYDLGTRSNVHIISNYRSLTTPFTDIHPSVETAVLSDASTAACDDCTGMDNTQPRTEYRWSYIDAKPATKPMQAPA